jgi:hypothetical protein
MTIRQGNGISTKRDWQAITGLSTELQVCHLQFDDRIIWMIQDWLQRYWR